ncbi:MAG: hypothetical protein PHG25_01910 [Candidatus Pacebacteria bacterium]|nr:hypothetical protein [Candidatus Paceibacterota bacterium]
MNADEEFPMLIYVGLDSGPTVFEIVEFAQRSYKGNHFCALTMRIENYYLYFEPCDYHAPLTDEQIPPLNNHPVDPLQPGCVFEHFLQGVRKQFAGVSFDQINIGFTSECLCFGKFSYND